MPKFLTDLKVQLKNGSDSIWDLIDCLVYKSDLLKEIVDVPGDFKNGDYFETDFASVPRIPIAYNLFGNRAHYESVIHDFLYCKDSKPVVSRKTADEVFLEAMKLRGKSWFVRYSMYSGVRLGGWTAYHKRNVLDKI